MQTDEKEMSVHGGHVEIFEHIPALIRFARSLCHDATSAEDLAQDTALRALERFEQFEYGTNLRSWLFRILKNIYIDKMRKESRAPQWLALNERIDRQVPTKPTQEYIVELQDLVVHFMELKKKDREIILLIGVEGVSYERVSEILDIPVGTIKSRLSRTRKKLRCRHLGEHELTQ